MKYQYLNNQCYPLYHIKKLLGQWNHSLRYGQSAKTSYYHISSTTCRSLFTNSCEQTKLSQEKFVSSQKETENKWKKEVLNAICIKKYMRTRKKYILSMFPYPSGNLHLGHVRVYAIADTMARFHHFNGNEVIHPMGWDSFGLPAENAAMERDENPAKWTEKNILKMKDQLKSLGCCFQWSREFATCDPSYYKWTQKIFLLLYKAGLAYRQEAIVNWDPIDKTVLANEQVSAKGTSWRSGAKVEKKLLLQWFIKSTRFSKELLQDLNNLPADNWESVANIQRNWIGECNGYVIEMKLSNIQISEKDYFLNLWMQHPEHLSKVSFIGLSTDHFLNQKKYFQTDVNGIKILKVNAIEPISRRLIPIVISDNFEYANGCQTYVGIPEHHEGDFITYRNLNFENCSENTTEEKSNNNMTRDTVLKKLREVGAGGYHNSSHLRDWLVSRQRYWGTPIPIVHCQSCGVVPVPDEDLPVQLPIVEGFVRKGSSVLKESPQWFNCKCPKCGISATRETDTLDTFMDSSWYFLRYLDAGNEKQLVSKDLTERFMPVDLYVGGIEHATLHLYYARFINKFLQHEGIVAHSEPFQNLLTLAVVKSKSFQVKSTGKYISSSEVNFSVSPPVEKTTGASLRVRFDKMSKSKYNGIDPQSVFDEYGVDATRLMIVGSTDTGLEMKWEPKAIVDSLNFLEKLDFYVKSLVTSRIEGLPRTKKLSEEETETRVLRLFDLRNDFILRVSHYLETRDFVLAVLELKKFLNELVACGQIMLLDDGFERGLRALLVMVSPFCPYTSAELWQQLNNVSKLPEVKSTENIFDQTWPSASPSYMRTLDCLINYKKIFSVEFSHSQLCALSDRDAKCVVRKRALLDHSLVETSILDEIFQSTINKTSVNILTMPKKSIRRHLRCTFKKETLCIIEVPQLEYETLTESSATKIASSNESFRKTTEDLRIFVSKFVFNSDGVSDLQYYVKKQKQK